MMGVLRDLFSLGSPKEKPNRHWQEIAAARRRVEELERRMRLSESQRYVIRSPLSVGVVEKSSATEEGSS